MFLYLRVYAIELFLYSDLRLLLLLLHLLKEVLDVLLNVEQGPVALSILNDVILLDSLEFADPLFLVEV